MHCDLGHVLELGGENGHRSRDGGAADRRRHRASRREDEALLGGRRRRRERGEERVDRDHPVRAAGLLGAEEDGVTHADGEAARRRAG